MCPKNLRGRPTGRLPDNPEPIEANLFSQGITHIAGLDEVGRGCLAGPVVAACCIFPPHTVIPGLRDSKELSPKAREVFYEVIRRRAIAFGIGRVEALEIDRINIHQATLSAMRLAIAHLPFLPGYLLIDGRHGIGMPLPELPIVRGDTCCVSIAAASILAKVTRDHLMCELEAEHPGFSFSQHKGYGTKQHLKELARFGPTPIHRRTFRGVCGSSL